MFRFRTYMQQADGNAYIFLKALLREAGDQITLRVINDGQFEVRLDLAVMPSIDDIEVNGLEPVRLGPYNQQALELAIDTATAALEHLPKHERPMITPLVRKVTYLRAQLERKAPR